MGQTQSADHKPTKSGFSPTILNLSFDPNKIKEDKKVLVIGSGCAGLGAAWHLLKSGVDVTVFEALEKLGGHANTIIADGIEVDTGFMVYNDLNYPNLCAFYEEIGVEGIDTTMGFSVSVNNGSFEWCSDNLQGLLSTPSNLWNPQFYAMMNDILRFNKEAIHLLSLSDKDPQKNIIVRDFLSEKSFSNAFRDFYLIPMTAAIWSASAKDILDFPAFTLFTFLNNHLLLQVSGHLNWKTPKNRSQEYVRVIEQMLGSRAHVNRGVKSIQRIKQTNGKTQIKVIDSQNIESLFDEIVFACHPYQALNILGSDITPLEQEYLSSFQYAMNDTYVHCDENLMPKAKSAWTSWNYIGTTDQQIDHKPVFVTYWLNKLQQLQHNKPIFVSLNPFQPPDPTKTFSKINYAHPQYTLEAIRAQKGIASIQGQNGTFFCGAWMGYGFHEDGFRSGIEVAMAISGKPVPWVEKHGRQAMVPASAKALAKYQNTSLISFTQSLITKPLLFGMEYICQQQVLSFFKQGFNKGKLQIILPNQQKLSFVGKEIGQEVVLQVYNPWFFVRLALEADLGLARSFIAGEWDIINDGTQRHPYDLLTSFLRLLIDNAPNGKTKVGQGLDVEKLMTSWLGTGMNYLWYRLTMDNSIANSRTNIHNHYDLSNDLFKLFLDPEYLMYSSAIFQTKYQINQLTNEPEILYVDSLEEAQLRKIDTLLQQLEPITSDMTLLDIGFGWGGISIRAAEKYGCKVKGITLSSEQKLLAEEKVKQKGLTHLISFELIDYRIFTQQCQKNNITYDRIVSCEMIEAVGHNHLGEFFGVIEQLLTEDGIFVMQAITMPDARYPLYISTPDFIKTMIFPGGCCPSLSALLQAMATNSRLHLEYANNTNIHYAETLRRWRYRFNDKHAEVLQLGFDESFIRLWNLYLCYCEAGFENQMINLQILTFSRVNNKNMLFARNIDS